MKQPCVTVVLLAVCACASAAELRYPTKAIRFIVPFPPGGGNDTMARMFGQKMTEGLNQQIVIEDHCIGCGLCASNCPYGNINMVPNEQLKVEAPDPDRPGRTAWVYQDKAATCDRCDPAAW